MNPLSEQQFQAVLDDQLRRLNKAVEDGNLNKKALATLLDIPYHTAVVLTKVTEEGDPDVKERSLTGRAFLNMLIGTLTIETAIEAGDLPLKTRKQSVAWAESLSDPTTEE